MSNIIGIDGSTPTSEETTEKACPTYCLRYANAEGDTEELTIAADVMMTNTYIGFVDETDQKLLFAIPMGSMIDLSLVEEDEVVVQ